MPGASVTARYNPRDDTAESTPVTTRQERRASRHALSLSWPTGRGFLGLSRSCALRRPSPDLWAGRDVQELHLGGLTRCAGRHALPAADAAPVERLIDRANGNAFLPRGAHPHGCRPPPRRPARDRGRHGPRPQPLADDRRLLPRRRAPSRPHRSSLLQQPQTRRTRPATQPGSGHLNLGRVTSTWGHLNLGRVTSTWVGSPHRHPDQNSTIISFACLPASPGGAVGST
jgi:hypothetical protein